MAGLRLLVARGRRSLYGRRWRGRGPRFAAVGPSGAASWQSARLVPPAWGWQRWGGYVGGKGRRAQRARLFGVGACVVGPLTARVRSFTQPPNPPIKRDRLRRSESGEF
jgi:hypothetical protein